MNMGMGYYPQPQYMFQQNQPMGIPYYAYQQNPDIGKPFLMQMYFPMNMNKMNNNNFKQQKEQNFKKSK